MKRNLNICKKCSQLKFAVHDHSVYYEPYCDASVVTVEQQEAWDKLERWPTFEEMEVPNTCQLKMEYIVLYEKKS